MQRISDNDSKKTGIADRLDLFQAAETRTLTTGENNRAYMIVGIARHPVFLLII
jgi:hypothetical protein